MKAKRGSALKLSYSRMDHRYEPKHSKHVDKKVYNKIINKFFEKLGPPHLAVNPSKWRIDWTPMHHGGLRVP